MARMIQIENLGHGRKRYTLVDFRRNGSVVTVGVVNKKVAENLMRVFGSGS